MEAVMYHSSSDQQISPNKNYFRTSKKIMNRTSLIPRFSEDFVPAGFLQAGLLQAPVHNHNPPFLSQSFPVFSVHHQQQQQPPLLPLPISNGGYGMNFSQSRTLSCPPNYGRINNNKNRSRDPSLTPKKSKQISKSPKKEDKLKSISSTVVPLGPDPENLPKRVPKVLSSSSSSKGCVEVKEKDNEGDKFSGSVVFTLSPPPSSLPLPTFSLRPKLSCNAEAAGIDTGATDNLCRLLRLR